MRPIFSPSVRVSVACPSRVGCGAAAGWIKSGLAAVASLSVAPGLFPFFPRARSAPATPLSTKLELRGEGRELAPDGLLVELPALLANPGRISAASTDADAGETAAGAALRSSRNATESVLGSSIGP